MPYVKRTAIGSEMLRPVSIAEAEGWGAIIAGESRDRPLVAWALLEDSEIIGLLQEGNLFVSAEQALNFQGFRKSRS